MENLRKWAPEKSKAYWEEQKADPDVGRDEDGPSWSKQRLWLPKNLFGQDSLDDRQGKCEDKGLNHSTKSNCKIDQETINQMRAEASRGFKRPFSATASLSGEMHRPLTSDAVTIPASATDQKDSFGVMEALRSTAGSAGLLQSRPAAATNTTPDGKRARERDNKSGIDDKGTKKTKADISDVKVSRMAAKRAAQQAIQLLWAKLETSMADAAVTLQSQAEVWEDSPEESPTLEERLV
eukprot:1159205-Pyramimonas_sp.AAC.1